MFWTLSLIEFIKEAPFTCTKDELLDYAERTGAPYAVIENLQELEDDGEDVIKISKSDIGINAF